MHIPCSIVYHYAMEQAIRVNVTLRGLAASRLAELASRMHVNEGTLARSLLTTALEELDPEARYITDVLNRIPGAWEDAQKGLAEIRSGKGIPLDRF
jgi:hypothetical protein